ncbi:MAG: DUF2683 domain-containing protein [Euryarchaeota archaeon]|nr:DUF2683 domain-containing protein [Euryarchaeota archaeon]
MVKAIIEIDDHTNQVLNIVKAQYALKDKSEAIETVVQLYEEEILEPELKPAYIKKINKIRKEKGIKVKSFADRYGLS